MNSKTINLGGPNITFAREDKEKLHMPHDDALGVEISIGDCMVKILLIDNGSSTDIIFFDNLKEMRYDVRKIKEEKPTNLDRFNGKPSIVLRIGVMPMITKGIIKYATMIVADTLSTYNAILGCP